MGDPHGARLEQENVEGDEDGVGQVEGDLGGRLDTHQHRGDEDGVGQVKEELSGGLTRVDMEARAWRPRGVVGFGGLGLKTTKCNIPKI
jgi:hypothetical protein